MGDKNNIVIILLSIVFFLLYFIKRNSILKQEEIRVKNERESKEKEEQIKKNIEEKREYSIKAQIYGMIGIANLIAKKDIKDDKKLQYLNKIETSAKEIMDIIENNEVNKNNNIQGKEGKTCESYKIKNSEKITIAILFENQIIADYLKELFEYYKFKVVQEKYDDNFLQKINSRKFELLIVEVEKNDKLLNEIKNSDDNINKNGKKEIPIMTISFLNKHEDETNRANNDFALPIDESLLFKAIEKILDGKIEVVKSSKLEDEDFNVPLINYPKFRKNNESISKKSMNNIVDAFLNGYEKQLNEILKYEEEHDIDNLIFALHRFKGSINIFCADKLVNKLFLMEEMLKNGKESIKDEFEIITKSMGKLIEELNALKTEWTY